MNKLICHWLCLHIHTQPRLSISSYIHHHQFYFHHHKSLSRFILNWFHHHIFQCIFIDFSHNIVDKYKITCLDLLWNMLNYCIFGILMNHQFKPINILGKVHILSSMKQNNHYLSKYIASIMDQISVQNHISYSYHKNYIQDSNSLNLSISHKFWFQYQHILRCMSIK